MAAQLTLGFDEREDRGPLEARAVPLTLVTNVLYGHVDAALSDRARQSVAAFRAHWQEWRSACALRSAPDALEYLLEASGFKSAWRRFPEFERARLEADAARLITAATRFAAAGSTARAGLQDVVQAIEDGRCEIPPGAATPGAVVCTSIVGAKGRRAQYAFIVGVAHERFPRIYVSHAMAFSKKYGLIVRENVAGGAAQTAKFAWYYAKHRAKARFLEGEARVLDYGLRRAERAGRATGYGTPPHWAAGHDLLARYGA